MAEVGSAELIIKAVDQFSATMKKFQEDTGKLIDQNKKTQTSVGSLGSAFSQFKNVFVGAAVATEAFRMITAFGEFDKTMRSVGLTLGLSGNQLTKFTNDLKDFGETVEKKTGIQAEAAGKAVQTLMVRAGLSYAEAKKQAVGYLYAVETVGLPARKVLTDITKASEQGRDAMATYTKAAYEQKDIMTELTKLKGALSDVEKTLGETIAKIVLPVIVSLTNIIRGSIDLWNRLNPSVQLFVVGLGLLAGVIKANVIPAIFSLSKAVIMFMVTNPVGWIMLIVGAVAILAIKFKEFREVVEKAINMIILPIKTLLSWILKLVSLLPFLNKEWKEKLKGMSEAVKGFNVDFDKTFKKVSEKTTETINVVKGDWTALWEKIQEKQTTTMDMMVSQYDALRSTFRDSLASMMENSTEFGDFIDVIWKKMRNIFFNMLADMLTNYINEFLAKMILETQKATSAIANMFGSVFGGFFGGIGGMVGKVLGFQHGGDFIAKGPTPIMVGEGTQAEQVSIKPVSGGGYSDNRRNTSNSFSINVAKMDSQTDVREVVRQLSYEWEQRQKVQML
jgi:hypothetical protein